MISFQLFINTTFHLTKKLPLFHNKIPFGFFILFGYVIFRYNKLKNVVISINWIVILATPLLDFTAMSTVASDLKLKTSSLFKKSTKFKTQRYNMFMILCLSAD